MKQISRKIVSFMLAFVMILGLFPVGNKSVAKAESSRSETEEWLKKHTPINGGYYRIWNDKVAREGAKTRLGDIPGEVDLVLVFYDNEMAKVSDEQMKKYVSELHGKGQKVIGSIFVHLLYDDIYYNEKLKEEIENKYKDTNYLVYKGNRQVLRFPNTTEGNEARAKFILHNYMDRYGFDGLDIDMEQRTEDFQKHISQYQAVLEHLSKEVGPKSGKDKIFIYDTTYSAFHPAFEKNKDLFDLVLIQLYGARSEYKNSQESKKDTSVTNNLAFQENKGMTLFETFSSIIPSEKIMIGFSFYEENSHTTRILPTPLIDNNRWYDIPMSDGKVEKIKENGEAYFEQGSFEDSRASRYALWQHDKGLKGGVFSYAIDRDGVPHPTRDDAQKMYDEYSKFLGNGTSIDIEKWVQAGRPGKSPQDDLMEANYKISKKLKSLLNKNKEYDKIDDKDFPDEYLRKQVIEQIGEYKGLISRYYKDLVLDDSKIKDLTGLEKITNLNKLTLKGLDKLTTLTIDNLPEGIKSERPRTEYKKSETKLVLEDLKGLKELNLSGLHLEELNIINPENFTSLEKLDVSDNNLDLAPGSNNRTVFDALAKNVKNSENVKFEGQDPFWYYPEKFSPDFVKLEAGKEYDVKEEVLKGQVTAQGYYVTQDKLDEYTSRKIDGKPFLKEGYEIKPLDYNKFNIETIDSSLRSIQDNIIKSDTEETFISKITNGEGKEVHKLKVVVGEEKDILFQVKPNLDKVYDSTAYNYNDAVGPRIFDGGIKELKNQFVTSVKPMEGNNVFIAFEIEDGINLTSWELIQISNVAPNRSDSNVKAELQYLDNDSFELEESDPYLKKIEKLKEQTWKTVDEIVDDSKDTHQGTFKKEAHKYWRVKIVSTKGGTQYDYPMIPEVKLFGTKLDKSPLVNAIADAKEYLQNKKGNEKPFAQEGLDKLREIVEDAERTLLTEKLTKELINSNAKSIADAIASLTIDNTEEKTEENITKENLNQKLAELIENSKKIDLTKVSEDAKSKLNETVANAELIRGNEEASLNDLKKLSDELDKSIKDALEEIKEPNKPEETEGENQADKDAEKPSTSTEGESEADAETPGQNDGGYSTPDDTEESEIKKYDLVVKDINNNLKEVSKDLSDVLSTEYKGGFESEIKEIHFLDKNGNKVTKFDSPMEVSVELKSLKISEKDTLRVFHIGENGVDEVKDVKVFGRKIMFKSDTFSPFVFVKGVKTLQSENTGDKTVTPSQGNTNTQIDNTNTTNPETGDNGIVIYVVIALVAVLALVWFAITNKKNKKL